MLGGSLCDFRIIIFFFNNLKLFEIDFSCVMLRITFHLESVLGYFFVREIVDIFACFGFIWRY